LEFVLDANIYVFAFGIAKHEICKSFLKTITEHATSHSVRICRTIAEEVSNNLTQQEFREFITFINNITEIEEDFLIPFDIGSKYEWKGLKPADALIAAYCEWAGADVLVTENRHFLSRQSDLPFKVLNSGKCLKLIRRAP
jgi:predicted nucleic acid-binding protein